MPDILPFTALAEEVRRRRPEVAVVLGSGLCEVADCLDRPVSVPFLEVPALKDRASVAGHKGSLTLGDWAGRHVLVFEGRLHYYEGHPWRKVVMPVQMAHELGARVLLLTNAAGGIRDDLVPGSLMAITDHIEWTRPYCWRHPGPGGVGPGRPSPYSPRLVGLLRRAAGELGLPLTTGVYAQMTGPCYETPAEVRALKRCGADAVGMSTAREIRAGVDLGMECAAVSCITNRAAGLGTAPIHHGEVLTNAGGRKEVLAGLVEKFLQLLEPAGLTAMPTGSPSSPS